MKNWRVTKKGNVMINLQLQINDKIIPYALLIQPVKTGRGETMVVMKLCEQKYNEKEKRFTYLFTNEPTWFRIDEIGKLIQALTELV